MGSPTAVLPRRNDGESNDATKEQGVKPHVILFVLASMFMVVYIERGAFASNSINGKKRSDEHPKGSGFQGEFDLNNFQDGVLASLFMVGVLVGSPVFSQAVHNYSPLRLVGVGTLIWTVTVLCCTFAQEFYSMAVFRLFVGFGEGALLAIGPTYIDDQAPKNRVALWLAILYLAIPCGFAIGFVLGSICESIAGWRSVFPTETLIMLPFLIFCFVSKPIALNINQTSDRNEEEHRKNPLISLWNDIWVVLSHPVYTMSTLGNVLHTGVLGVLAYFGAKAAKSIFDVSNTDLWIGVIVLIAGMIGILAGGIVLDLSGSSIPMAMVIASASIAASGVIMAPAILAIKSFAAFVFPFGLTFTLLFLNQAQMLAPVAAVTLWSVPLHLRPLATSASIIFMHFLGDLPSPAICGALLDYIEDRLDHGTDEDKEAKAYRIAFAISSVFLILSAGLYLWTAKIGTTANNYRLLAERSGDAGTSLLGTAPGDDEEGH